MFIDALTVVDIMVGKCAGRRGVVDKIRISNHDASVTVFVRVFNPQSGASDLMMFDPIELKKSRLSAVKIERLQLMAMVDA